MHPAFKLFGLITPLFLPLAIYADSNNNPCIENWQTTSIPLKPYASVNPLNLAYTVGGGQTVNVGFSYSIVDGSGITADITQCRGAQQRAIVVIGSFANGARSAQQSLDYTPPASIVSSRMVYVPAPGIFIYYNDVNDKPQSYWYNPGVTAPVMVVINNIPVDPTLLGGPSFYLSADGDEDTLVDQWELHYFGNLDQTPDGDYDQDGLTNLQEANIGFDPTVVDHLLAPKVSVPAGSYSGYLLVRLANPNPIGVIRYSLDGQVPTNASPTCVSGDGVRIDELGNVKLRAGIFVNGAMLSELVADYVISDPVVKNVAQAKDVSSGAVVYYNESGATVTISYIITYHAPTAPGDYAPEVWNYNTTTRGTGWIYFSSRYDESSGANQQGVAEHGTIAQGTDYWFVPPYGPASFMSATADSDGDGILDIYEMLGATDMAKADTDGDGLNDGYEAYRSYLNPINRQDGSADADGDGKTFLQEIIARTDPFHNENDADGDGLSNEDEINKYHTNPNLADTDNDGLPDAFEISIGSNPLVARQELVSLQFQATLPAGWHDADGDWMPDAYENLYPFLNAYSATDATADYDGDGLTNYQEYKMGTRPDIIDTDGDGMPDGWEVSHGLNPKDPTDGGADKDGDGLINVLEWQFNSDPTKVDGDVAATGKQIAHPVTGVINTGDGLTDLQEVFLGLNPLVYDADNSSPARTGLSHWLQFTDPGTDTTDHDGLSDLAERVWSTHPDVPDTDGDGMPDSWEVACGLNPLDPADAAQDQDKDGDGLTNLQEYQMGLLPYDYDTDGDGLGDGWEVAKGLDPKSGRTGLIAWWRFDGSGSVFNDSGNLKHDGILRGAAAMGGSGKFAGALSLDGKDSYAIIKDQPDLALDDSSTLTFWFKPAVGSLATTRQLLDKRGSYTLEVVPVGVAGPAQTNHLVFTWLIDGEAHTATSTAPLVAAAWNHISLTLDREAGEIRFSLNGMAAGVQAADLEDPFDPSPWPLMLGSQRVLPVSRTPNGLLDDVRLYTRVLPAAEIALLAHPEDPSLEPNQDRDGDGLTELDEYLAGTNPQATDTDGDGLSDLDELITYHTDPRLADTDGDGLSDSIEINTPRTYVIGLITYTYHTSPTHQDTDGDGLNDYDEVMVYQTSSDPTNTTARHFLDRDGTTKHPVGWDTDGDGMPDGWEVLHGLRPANSLDDQGNPEASGDLDGDGITNLGEYLQDKDPKYPDDISQTADSDDDGLTDWQEKYIYHTDLRNTDTIGDGLGDLYRVTNGLISPDGTITGHPEFAASAIPTGDTQTNLQKAQQGTNPRDPTNLSAVVLRANPIQKIPKKIEIEHGATPPLPKQYSGGKQSLSYQLGDSIYIAEDLVNERLIAVVDRIYVKDPQGRVDPLQLSVGGKVKEGVRPDRITGSPATAGYEYHLAGAYNITGFIDKLQRDPQTGLVSFQLVAEVDVPYVEKPDPNGNGSGNGNGDGSGPGGPGGSGGSGTGGGGGYGGLQGILLWLDPARGLGAAVQPAKQEQADPVIPTWATTQLTAYVNNRLDLAVSHAFKPEEYLSEKDEDNLGAIASLAKNGDNNTVVPPVKKSKLRVGKGPSITDKQMLTWDDNKLVVLNGLQELTSPHVFTGNDVRNLEIYGKFDASGVVTVSLEGLKADNTAVPGITPDALKVVLVPILLRVDSNNDGMLDENDDIKESEISATANRTIDLMGQHLHVNDPDLDNDKVPDYFDGFGVASDDHGGIDGGHFVKMQVKLPPGLVASGGQVQFSYNASDPAGVTGIVSWALPANGTMRIWRRDASQERNPVALSNNVSSGDFISSDVPFPAASLFGGADFGELYIEAVRPSTMWASPNQTITLSQVIDGVAYPLGQVHTTATKAVFNVYVWRPYVMGNDGDPSDIWPRDYHMTKGKRYAFELSYDSPQALNRDFLKGTLQYFDTSSLIDSLSDEDVGNHGINAALGHAFLSLVYEGPSLEYNPRVNWSRGESLWGQTETAAGERFGVKPRGGVIPCGRPLRQAKSLGISRVACKTRQIAFLVFGIR
jgi:hypothetical protein